MKRKPSPLSLPQTIDKKQLRVSPTGYGYLFLAVIAAILLGSINYNNNLAFLFSFLLGGMAAVSVLHGYRNICGLEIRSVTGRPVFAGDTAAFDVLAQTGASPRLNIHFRLPPHSETAGDITASNPQHVSVKASDLQRGMFRADNLLIHTHYPLGLVRWTARLPLDIHCLVYPKPISGPVRTGAASAYSPNGNEGHAYSGMEDFNELQTYRPGDPLQHIYWKTFSREQGLHIKGFTETTGTSIIFDWDAVRGMDIEYRLSRLCDMVLEASRLNLSYGLKLPDRIISPDSGDAHRQVCLKALALFNTDGDTP
jgi:uncharacterized protein (DUF58 family)